MPSALLRAAGRLKYVLLLSIIILSGCVREDDDDCPPGTTLPPDPPVTEQRQLIYFRIEDILTGADITATEELEEIEVYLFDRNESLVRTLELPLDQIRSGEPLDVTGMNLEGGYVSVWTDMGQTLTMTPTPVGALLDNLEVSIPENAARLGYYTCPGDIFFGHENLRFTAISDTETADTVYLRRKNAQLHVTVRGLPQTRAETDYYFLIDALYDGYDFTGDPLADARSIWEDGEFDATGDFVSPAPYIMIHNLIGDIYSDTHSVRIRLLRDDGLDTGNPEIIASSRDTDGMYIDLRSGMTTNVLMLITETGELEVVTRFTPWGKIYQWVQW